MTQPPTLTAGQAHVVEAHLTDRAAHEQLLRAGHGEGLDPAEMLARIIGRPAWHARAACRGQDPDLFFPTRGQQHLAELARRVCADCPARQPCLDHALELGRDAIGIWGGTTAQQRRAMRAREEPADAA